MHQCCQNKIYHWKNRIVIFSLIESEAAIKINQEFYFMLTSKIPQYNTNACLQQFDISLDK